MKTKNQDLIDTKINNIKIIGYYKKNHKQYFECVCFCGNNFNTRTDHLKSGMTKSCGCKTGDLISQNNKLPDNQAAINLIRRHYENNASKRGLKFLLSDEQFVVLIFGKCIYCGAEPRLVKFTTSQKNRRDKEIAYNGIDRMNNTIGYTATNCVSCCSICNAAKSDLSFDDFKNWIQRLVTHNAKQENL